MMHKHLIKNILFCCLLFLGCGNDPFVNVIDLGDRAVEPVYAATAQWAVQDTLLRVFLSQSIFISTPSNYVSLPDATVFLRHNEQEDYFSFNPVTNYFESEIPLPTNETMELFVEIDDQVLSAKQTFPDPPLAVDLADLERIVNDTMIVENGHIDISISDNPAMSSYYIIEMEGIGVNQVYPDQQNIVGAFGIGSDNPLVDHSSINKVFINDNEFNGNEITLQIFYGSIFLINLKEVTLRVRSVSKEGYDFELSSARILESSSNPLSEPVILKSNIENGTGVFSVGTTYEATVTL